MFLVVPVWIAVAGLLLIAGPPVWWYARGRRIGERRNARWSAILFGVILLGSIGRAEPPVDWTGAAAIVIRALAGVWLIAYGARGSKAK